MPFWTGFTRFTQIYSSSFHHVYPCYPVYFKFILHSTQYEQRSPYQGDLFEILSTFCMNVRIIGNKLNSEYRREKTFSLIIFY